MRLRFNQNAKIVILLSLVICFITSGGCENCTTIEEERSRQVGDCLNVDCVTDDVPSTTGLPEGETCCQFEECQSSEACVAAFDILEECLTNECADLLDGTDCCQFEDCQLSDVCGAKSGILEECLKNGCADLLDGTDCCVFSDCQSSDVCGAKSGILEECLTNECADLLDGTDCCVFSDCQSSFFCVERNCLDQNCNSDMPDTNCCMFESCGSSDFCNDDFCITQQCQPEGCCLRTVCENETVCGEQPELQLLDGTYECSAASLAGSCGLSGFDVTRIDAQDVLVNNFGDNGPLFFNHAGPLKYDSQSNNIIILLQSLHFCSLIVDSANPANVDVQCSRPGAFCSQSCMLF